ncbi:hypothetical protein LSCM1_03104 [Leishmania martiniquensis]|uniref:Uncharacterized protein n=1 Tax=Leishmania martiniquensis TaxID=1580590 RepID=A0A836GL14_9TRYP|nr:hypothetical protein LSCM1_03104 [Leishmania martiniquensis]
MDTVEVVLSPSSTVKCAPAGVEQSAAEAEEYTDRLYRDQYYCGNGNCSTAFSTSLSASVASPAARTCSATDDLHDRDATAMHSPVPREVDLAAVYRGDRSSARKGSRSEQASDIRSSNRTAGQTALRARSAGPRGVETDSSRERPSTEFMRDENAPPWRIRSANPCHADPHCTFSLPPPPPMSYVASRRDPRSGKAASVLGARSSSAVCAPSTSPEKPRGTVRTRSPVFAGLPPCQLHSRRAAMQKRIARFLMVEEATVLEAGDAACAAQTSRSPAREASAVTATSTASSPWPRTPAGGAERLRKCLAADLPLNTEAAAEPRRHGALFSSLSVNQIRSAAAKRCASAAEVSTSSPASFVGGAVSGRRNGRATLADKRDVAVKTDRTRLSSSLAQASRKSLTFSPSPCAYPAPSASADTTATALSEGPLDTAKVRIFREAVVTVTCAMCALSINLFAFRLSGTQLTDVCYCPFCGSRCSWAACTETV